MISLISAIQIMLLNYFYQYYAIKLTNIENHRTDTEYDDSLISKLFAFNFINSYSSLFFIAFIKHYLGETCQSNACMIELAYQLTIIFGKYFIIVKFFVYVIIMFILVSKLVVDKVTGYVNTWMNKVTHLGEDETNYSQAELEKRLNEYDPSLGVLQDYAQLLVQFGYVTLFVAACPIVSNSYYSLSFLTCRRISLNRHQS